MDQSDGLQKGRALVTLALALDGSRDDEALKYLDSASNIFQEKGAMADLAKSEAEKIHLFGQNDLNYRAIRAYEKLDTLINLIKSDSAFNRAKVSAAMSYAELGKPQLGIGLLYEVLGRYREAQDTSGQIATLEMLVYEEFATLDPITNLALYDSIISLASAYSGMTAEGLSGLYNNRASELLMAGMYDEAELSMRLADEQAILSGKPSVRFLYNAFTNAELALARGELEKAKYFMKKCSDLLDSTRYTISRMVIMEARSHYYLLDGNRAESDVWFEKSRFLADSLNFPGQYEEMLLVRSQILKALGDYQNALAFYEKRTRLRDSSLALRQSGQIAEMRIVNETELAESENKFLRQQNENILLNKKRDTWMFVAILAFVLLVGGILMFFLARTRRLNNSISSQNEQLASQNEKLIQLTEDNELLMGIVAHDLKAPLTKVESLIGLLLPAEELGEDKKALLDMTLGVIEGGKNLVEDILILSEAGRETTPELLPTSLGDLILGVSRDFQEISHRKEIEIQLVHTDQVVRPLLHPPYIIRVLDNLISNAIKFSPRGSKVVLSWGSDASGTWCKVTDFGPGIPPEDQERLFQRFARLSNRPTEGESSTGLGLFIVKTLLDTMNASISLESKQGKGSSFTVRFVDSGSEEGVQPDSIPAN